MLRLYRWVANVSRFNIMPLFFFNVSFEWNLYSFGNAWAQINLIVMRTDAPRVQIISRGVAWEELIPESLLKDWNIWRRYGPIHFWNIFPVTTLSYNVPTTSLLVRLWMKALTYKCNSSIELSLRLVNLYVQIQLHALLLNF